MLFAIGDIHGCADELRALVNKLPITPETTLVFVGDYVDRGPRSREVIDTILELREQCRVVALAGNHEDMFLDYLDDPTSARAGAFIYSGGSATLASYADAHGEVQVPAAHRRFLEELPVLHETDGYVFVHAGLPQVPLAALDPVGDRHAMLWMRGRFLTSDYDWGKVVVHGHTPVTRVEVRPHRINIDTGCVFDHRLTALALPGERAVSVRRMSHGPRVVLRDRSSRRAAFRFQGAVPVRVQRGGATCELVTVDYSELGMGLLAREDPGDLGPGDRIEGVIGPDPSVQVAFTGVIVRRTSDDQGVRFGVKIHETRPAT